MPDTLVHSRSSKSMRDSTQAYQPRVGVIVLHWNKIAETRLCIQSLSNLHYQNLRIFLIDNGSDIDLESLVGEEFSNIRVIRSNENIGFAGGCNIGISASIEDGCEFVWLLNNDTTVDSSALGYLVEKAEAVKPAGIIGSTILEKDNRNIVNHMGGRIYPYLGLCVHLGKGSQYVSAPKESDINPSYVTGCSMLARVKMIQEVGLLDEGYFLYWEDADWCVRAQRMGWKIAIAYESEVYHEGSSSLGSASPLKGYYLARNSLRFVYKLYPWLSPLALVWWPRRYFLNHVLRGRFQHARMAFRGLIDVLLQRVLIPEGSQCGIRRSKKTKSAFDRTQRN